MFVRCCVNEEMNNTTLCIPSPKGLIDLFCSMFYFVNILSACHAGMTYMSGMQIDSISYHDSYKWVLPVLRRILRLHWDKAERVSQLISSRVLPWVRHLPFQLWGTWLYMGKFFSASWDRVSASLVQLQVHGAVLFLWSGFIFSHMYFEGHLLISGGFYVTYLENFQQYFCACWFFSLPKDHKIF